MEMDRCGKLALPHICNPGFKALCVDDYLGPFSVASRDSHVASGLVRSQIYAQPLDSGRWTVSMTSYVAATFDINQFEREISFSMKPSSMHVARNKERGEKTRRKNVGNVEKNVGSATGRRMRRVHIFSIGHMCILKTDWFLNLRAIFIQIKECALY